MVSGKQWIRQCRAEIRGEQLELSDMQVEFQVRMSTLPHPDWCYLRIMNLSDSTVDSCWGENARLKLEAGYKDRIGPIFDGNAQQMRRGKLPDGVTKYFDIIGADGRLAYGFSTVQKTLKKDSTYKDIIDEAMRALKEHGITEGHISEMGDSKFPRSMTLFGQTRDILNRVAEATNSTWYISQGKLNMIKNDEYLPGGTIEINADTGMIGLPEQQLKGIVVKILLNPDAHPGQQVHIDEKAIQRLIVSQGFPGTEEVELGPFGSRGAGSSGSTEGTAPKIAQDGMYQIVRVDHDGNMEGLEWYTTLTCVALNEQGPAPASPGNIGKGDDSTMRGIPAEEKQNKGDQGGGGGGGP